MTPANSPDATPRVDLGHGRNDWLSGPHQSNLEQARQSSG